jgi:hypothetical protein
VSARWMVVMMGKLSRNVTAENKRMVLEESVSHLYNSHARSTSHHVSARLRVHNAPATIMTPPNRNTRSFLFLGGTAGREQSSVTCILA